MAVAPITPAAIVVCDSLAAHQCSSPNAVTLARRRTSNAWPSAKRPKTAAAEGTLTQNGQNVEGATVILAPEAAAAGGQVYGASGVTDSSGHFALSAFPPDEGVVPGRYTVGVTKLEAAKAAAGGPDSHEGSNALPPPKHLLPEKYSDPNQSGLSVEIPAGGKTDIKLELK